MLDFDFGVAVAARIADLYGRVRTVVTDKLPAELPKVGTHPALYVVQSRQAGDEGYGQLAASVTLALYGRSRIVSAPPREDFDELFEAAGWVVDVTRNKSEEVSPSVWLSSVRLNIKRGWLAVPFIDPAAKVNPTHSLNRVGAPGVFALADMIASELHHYATSARGTLSGFEPGQATAQVSTSEDGVTTERLTLPFRLKLDTDGRSISGATLCALALPQLVGQLVPGLGVCTEAVDAKPTEGRAWSFSFVRRQPEAEEDGYPDNDYSDDEPGVLPAFTDRTLEAAYDETR